MKGKKIPNAMLEVEISHAKRINEQPKILSSQ